MNTEPKNEELDILSLESQLEARDENENIYFWLSILLLIIWLLSFLI